MFGLSPNYLSSLLRKPATSVSQNTSRKRKSAWPLLEENLKIYRGLTGLALKAPYFGKGKKLEGFPREFIQQIQKEDL